LPVEERASLTAIVGVRPQAARPVLSKDGKTLAFIRRIYDNTTLVVKNLETYNEQIVYRLLDFDQQESSAPCGIYPSFAFINNDTEVLIWVKGGKFARFGPPLTSVRAVRC
jgi:hypothetical protein